MVYGQLRYYILKIFTNYKIFNISILRLIIEKLLVRKFKNYLLNNLQNKSDGSNLKRKKSSLYQHNSLNDKKKTKYLKKNRP